MAKDHADAASANVSRRGILRAGAATALIAAAKTAFPGGANVAWAAGPEIKGTRLGFIALTDASPLIIAKEKGFFDKYGLPEMEIVKQASWAAMRDNITLGSAANGIDGAHILAPKIHLYTAGKVTQNNRPVPMYNLLHLNAGCQGISISNAYKDLKVGLDAAPLKAAFAAKRKAGNDVKVAMTFPGGTHDLWLRYWLAAGGIDPDRDVYTTVVPPPQMVANMKVGNMDAFCVGEPWNEQLANQGVGYTACVTGEIWPDHPEKVLGMRADWVDANPRATLAIMMATMEAQQWCDRPENKQEMAAIVGKRQWFNVPPADIIGRLRGDINYGNGRTAKDTGLLMKFWGGNGAVSYPWKSLASWFVVENIRWGRFAPTLDIKALVDRTTRNDLWLEAAKSIGVANPPSGDSRGIEKFFDGKIFDPAKPLDYLKSVPIKRVSA